MSHLPPDAEMQLTRKKKKKKIFMVQAALCADAAIVVVRSETDVGNDIVVKPWRWRYL